MNKREFEKIIRFEELATTNDTTKFMFKSYLDCLLIGGKKRENMFIYGVSKLTDLIGNKKLFLNMKKLEIKLKKRDMWEEFKKSRKQGFWVTETTEIEEYDENGNMIEQDFGVMGESQSEEEIISKKIEITTKTTYFLNKPIDIKPLDYVK